MAEEKKYCIKVPGALVEVSEEVYLTYFRARRRWSAQNERDTYNGVISYDAMDTEETLGEETIPDSDSPSVEDTVVGRLLREKLHHCLGQLSKPEQTMLHALYFQGMSERQVADKLGLHHMTLHCRKISTLRKLRKMMER